MVTKLRQLFVQKFIDPYIWFYMTEDLQRQGINVRMMWKKVEICTVFYPRYELVEWIYNKQNQNKKGGEASV